MRAIVELKCLRPGQAIITVQVVYVSPKRRLSKPRPSLKP